MKASDLRNLTDEELNQRFKDLRTELFNLRFQSITGQLGNPKRINVVKKDIARVKTILRERELSKEKQGVR
ncbi:MAG: large subunit ribosomal protein [Candidatus Atribacteria bacterium]|nr:large subunit ribosomal protein [Candidatus Atribacteria bacterium]